MICDEMDPVIRRGDNESVVSSELGGCDKKLKNLKNEKTNIRSSQRQNS